MSDVENCSNHTCHTLSDTSVNTIHLTRNARRVLKRASRADRKSRPTQGKSLKVNASSERTTLRPTFFPTLSLFQHQSQPPLNLESPNLKPGICKRYVTGSGYSDSQICKGSEPMRIAYGITCFDDSTAISPQNQFEALASYTHSIIMKRWSSLENQMSSVIWVTFMKPHNGQSRRMPMES